ncbi:MAG: MarR family winged helix-turn-helix transcriptional regulator [Ferrovibrio sp.]|uniref:MarR family winged helix-turn-helix transcriptional regulator n=1 Tax=Ciceribacter sichuanensis TaxID=2949647 RepID=A0AAJ1BVN0_9HYPH|nr:MULTISPECIES: MarR family winged helix-turn-helix transcriptional regulator [Alphaproteobacteria]MCM2398751.1 MarR family winged helix-turn-helix transcriptional regulator [Ciceribacter sp. S95]MCM2403650.1 MarR family winged helix-turn-helix transcriptional regulator [Ciceribacter sp. S153]MCO5957043.1 MarR family winged helix-turn-helix transcriptional regulator [Ciceribacter sp. S101]MCW0232240.1 MarR family winged helix-turn-helix transcriptional regulator [Ferrovibrio sp.]
MTENKAEETALGSTKIDFSMMEDAVGYRLRRAQLAVFQHFNETFAAKGLRPTDFAVLLLLTRNQGSKQSEVAEALGIQRANFVAIVDGLEHKGFVERRKSDLDRRVQSLYITDAGLAYLNELMPIWQEHEGRLLAQLGGPEARDQLIGLLKKLYD